MSTKTEETKKSQFEYEYKKDYQEDLSIHKKYTDTLDPLEAMLLGQVYDDVSNSIDGSKITDSYTATLAIERAARIMGKLPEGRTESVTDAEEGTAAFMDILRQKYIYPNANSQFPFETKMELVQLYSDVYGYMPVFEDWNVTDDYVGPDCWLWNPRHLIFQQGTPFFRDMNYVTALTWVDAEFLEDIIDEEKTAEEESGWNVDALKELLDVAKNATSEVDSQRDTNTERTRIGEATKRGICLATRYEAGEEGEWVTFAPDHGYVEVRRLQNPHKTGRIPFRIKYSQELLDSIYGLGDFQRSKPLQFARDGLTNFYFKGIKMNLIPPIVVNANGVLKHTIDYREGGVMMETIPNSVRRLETSNAGLSTYQGAQSNLTGSLLSLWGTQNASMPGAETLNPTQGKTPAAINMFSDKEATRDGRARKRLEVFIEELTSDFYELMANIGTETVPVNLFASDLEKIDKNGGEDVRQLFENDFTANSTFTGGQLKIKASAFKDKKFHFNIDFGSTARQNEQAQLTQLDGLMDRLAKFQNQFKDDPRIDVNWAEILSAYASLGALPNAERFVMVKDAPSPQEQQLMDEVKGLQDQLAQKEQEAQAAAAAPTGPTSTINGAGMFQDPEIGAVAHQITKL